MPRMFKSAALFATAVALPSEAASDNCFVLLDKPLDSAPFSDDEILALARHFRDNINVNHTGAVIASPGAVPALKGCCEGGYQFHWMRDGALSMQAFTEFAQDDLGNDIVSTDDLEYVLMSYAGWVFQMHNRTMSGNGKKDDDFGEPKWVIPKGIPYPGGWCRPQTDGPPLRARSLMTAARSMPASKDVFWKLAKLDLEWLSSGVNVDRQSCDLWEETIDSNLLWNRVAMRAALLEGSQFAAEMGEDDLAQTYLHAAEDYVRDPFTTHVEKSQLSFATECPVTDASQSCNQYKKDVDGAVILALVHGRLNTRAADKLGKYKAVPLPTDVVVANTVRRYNEVFCKLYSINRADTESKVPGVLYGRYEMDQYGGGNPWILITSALANLMYQASQQISGGAALTSSEISAWKDALSADDDFAGEAEDFIAAGDSILSRLRSHIADEENMHLYEQLDRNSGKQYNAQDLTWSYAETLSALVERAHSVSNAAKARPKANLRVAATFV
eukprot:TRINITY_DN16907_c0_g3_i1.p1 TRINITY_DN16907_c0_g3~~TRINITY_DN16907_c0_g3_i1.p1  ORF type:complete len:502 (+),score=92.37 TRINITY_DN16907_c0_g3_i1:48-1553(+)